MKNLALTWHEWFTTEKQEQAYSDFSSIKDLLRRNGLLSLTARKWIREQIGREIDLSDEDILKVERIKSEWIKTKTGIEMEKFKAEDIYERLEEEYVNERLLQEYSENEVKAVKWAENKWSEFLPQIYLENKEKYDSAIVKSLSVPQEEQGLAREIYFAVKEGEIDIEDTPSKYGKSVKCTKGGGIRVRFDEIKPVMKHFIQETPINSISSPFRVDNRVAIIEVKEYNKGRLNDEIKAKLIKETLEEFIVLGIESLCKHLSQV